ncbi:hypothetical protein MLD38_009331 [Melastoma candidum]|uniref:Uncharacterized protein n=1 Tax=Melastoma candidum TaxID=119954 RepID=A0ACB9RYL6_9MYRT|nr:hypothetical protein MLD38_009331 [Melastoma candidum]
MEEQTLITSPVAAPGDPTNSSPQDQIFDPHPARKPNKSTKLKRRRKRVCSLRYGSEPTTSSSFSSPGVVCRRRRSARLSLSYPGRHSGFVDVDAVALPLGMSFAAVVAQVLESGDGSGEQMPIDRLSRICTWAVGEALSNVFGSKCTLFVDNFEKSFRSTLSTLRLLKESSSLTEGSDHNTEFSEKELSRCNVANRGCSLNDSSTREALEHVALDEEVREALPGHDEYRETSKCNQGNELTCFSDSSSGAWIGQPMFSTFERSLMEQRRSNDLKELELSLSFRKMKLKETQLSLSNDANHLERSKLAMRISKASFEAEKFKNQLEDTRYAELLRKCIDCLVAGLLLMSASLAYGTYVYSYQRITEATASCSPLNRASKSWWIPEPVASLNSGFQMLSCQVQVLSRMLFGILMILVIAYLLLQRSTASSQSMPITFLLLLLGVVCGYAGKLCVDTLGGSGYHWLFFWEAMCLVHFFSNICTSSLFIILHGPVAVSHGMKRDSMIIPYWFRRSVFYGAILVVLPLLCGLVPFGGPFEWKEHISQLVAGVLSEEDDGDWY